MSLTAVAAYVYAGGFSVGVRRAGFDVLCHLEGDNAYGVDSARLNWPDLPIHYGPNRWPLDDLRNLDVDYAFANPPCAIWSPMGTVSTRGREGQLRDPRLQHWHDSFNVLEAIAPRAWCLESVPQAYTTGRHVIDEYTKRALVRDYSVTHLLLDARWTGIPQSRKRFFIVAHRPARLVGYEFDWTPPPTVGEALRGINDPGWNRPVLEKYRTALAETRPGERLCVAWQRVNPGFTERRNVQGKVAGRPSFQDRRLRFDEVMGAYVGDKLYHPTEDRMIGIQEAKRLTGYPPDFQLAGPPSGWSSLLARAVMPPVGQWLAGAIATTLTQRDATRDERRVTFVDVREPGRAPVDLTPDYLDDRGRVRVRVRTDGTVDWTPGVCLGAVRPPPRYDTPAPVRAPDAPPRAVPAIKPVIEPRREGDAGTARPDDPRYRPEPGEGSGKLIKRLWKTTNLSPDELVAVVHANYPGRTTKVGDVYYNYNALVKAGENVRPWPGRLRPRRSGGEAFTTVTSPPPGPPAVESAIDSETASEPTESIEVSTFAVPVSIDRVSAYLETEDP